MLRKRFLLMLSIFIIGQMFVKAQDKNWPVRHQSFKEGEKLTFVLRYGLIVGGQAEVTLQGTELRNKKVLHARARAYTTGFVDKLFNVDDVFESYFDPVTILPYKAVRDVHEGNYKFYNEVFFYHQDSSVYSKKSGVHKVPGNILDMISTLYYLRSIEMERLKKGDVVEFITYFSDEVFPFYFRYSGKETVSTKLGKFSCHRFDPIVEPGRMFESEDDMKVWITDDKNLLPVLVQFDLLVGSVKCELIDYTNIKYPLHTLK